MSLRGRLLLASLALLSVGLLVADAATFIALRSFLTGQVDARLASTAESLERSREGTTAPDRRPRRGGNDDQLGIRTTDAAVWAQVRDSSGRVVASTSDLDTGEALAAPRLPDPLPAPAQTSGAARSSPDESDLVSVALTVPADNGTGPGFRVLLSRDQTSGAVYVTALPLDEVQDTLSRLLLIEGITFVAVLGASTALGLWLVGLGLRPLDDISDTAAEIAAGDLSKRVERDDDRTEVGRLGGSLNVMLGQIETAFAEREASEERLRRFVADASHELRTPLAAIGAYSELFERGADQHPEDLPRLMANIRKETLRMGVLVDDLLLLTRLDQGRPLEQQPVDLGAIAADGVEAARAVEPDRPVGLHVDGLVEVRGDRARLRQIVDNLLANVRVHTPAGTAVEVSVTAADGLGVIRVVDHGPGLPAEERSHVFERFYRADPSRSRADGGSGLGLSIVAAIVEAHHGRVAVEETPGGGATFTVALPLLATAD